MNARVLLEKLVDCAMARNNKLGGSLYNYNEDDLNLSTLIKILDGVEVYATYQPQRPLRGRVSTLNIMARSSEDQDDDCIVIGVSDIYRYQGDPVYGSRDDFEDLMPYEIYLDGTRVGDGDGEE